MYFNKKLLLSIRHGELDKFLSQDKYNQSIIEQELGEIYLPTGKIVANDPLCLFETEPFELTVPSGKYPVVLYVLHVDTDRRVAFAEIRFSGNVPQDFKPALLSNQDINKLEEDSFYGYGVDSGTGGFMDMQTCEKLKLIVDKRDDGMFPELEKALEESYVHTYSTANVCLPETNHNVVAFSSGYGDGGYPSFWGNDIDGKICCLITDFCIIDNDTDDIEVEVAEPKSKGFWAKLFGR